MDTGFVSPRNRRVALASNVGQCRARKSPAWSASMAARCVSSRSGIQRRGFTLVELLVVITIIGILISLLMPAVQSAREAARRVQCQNNVKQLALGMLSHEASVKRFPSGGWGWYWVGDPDRGFSWQSQPGGWIYTILPFIEQSNLFQMGSGQPTAQKLAASGQRISTPLAMCQCPSRRATMAYPTQDWLNTQYGATTQATYARSDYCANAGDQVQPWDLQGPPDLATGDSWTATNAWVPPNTGVNLTAVSTGICYLRSQITAAHVTDGLSNTYLVGEKYLNADNYTNGLDNADNESMYTGYDNDNHRCTNPSSGVPLQDIPGYTNSCNFGSVHAGSFNMAFCDGSVHSISYNIDLETHRRLGNRSDGLLIDWSKLQ
jgi:prepilin-type N-terminal cleavage/methylation domain-containing protein/prepilin-type processing-associated H-X9-DG protein